MAPMLALASLEAYRTPLLLSRIQAQWGGTFIQSPVGPPLARLTEPHLIMADRMDPITLLLMVTEVQFIVLGVNRTII